MEETVVRLIEVRQPREHDLIGRRFALAGLASGFEATVLWRVIETDGDVLGEGQVQGAGSMGVVQDFAQEVSLPAGTNARGAHVLLQVFGDDPSGLNPPGLDLHQVRVTLFTGLSGFRLHEVVPGDTLSAIARDHGQGTTADDVFEANRDTVMDPDRIFPGQVLRVPLL
jgi:Immunoglobulin-like domain of bacterial spore germination/LysM domain